MNPEVVRAIYSKEVPSLENAEVDTIGLLANGPTVKISFVAENFPSAPPSKWAERGYNAAKIILSLSSVRGLMIQGWETENVLNLRLERMEKGLLSFSGVNKHCKIEVEFEFLYIEITAYQDDRRIG